MTHLDQKKRQQLITGIVDNIDHLVEIKLQLLVVRVPASDADITSKRQLIAEYRETKRTLRKNLEAM